MLSSTERDYTHYRAIAAKATMLQKLDLRWELDSRELRSLANAYSYFHAQRLSTLFDSCHEALWRVFETEKDPARLLRLFRHSSFVWRIRGDEAKEKHYLARLKQKNIQSSDASNPKTLVYEVGYYMRRLKFILIEVSGVT